MNFDTESTSAGGGVKRLARTILSHRRFPLGVALLALVLALPSLGVGWLIDDHFHRAAVLGSQVLPGGPRSTLDMFRFLDGDPNHIDQLMDLGLAPWWTYRKIKGAFWRPVTAVTHWVDYRLWPDCAALMHAHSILWFAGLAGGVALLYRRFMGVTWVAGLAAVLYAVDDSRGMPVGFLANRNAILATLFGVWALLAHDRWRRDGWRIGAGAGPFLLGLSLLSAEAGIATCAYLAAHAVFLDRDRWWGRCRAMVPYAVVVAAWRIVWTRLDYGVSGLAYYVDPLDEPLRYAAAVLERAPLLMLGQWAGPPPDITLVLPSGVTRLIWVAALAFLVLLGLLLVPLLRRERTARFWAMGMLLSLAPICATFPSDRLLLFVGIGAMGLLAQFLADVFGRADRQPASRVRRGTARGLGYFFVLVHLILAPPALAFRTGRPMGSRKSYDAILVNTPLDRSVERQDVVIVNPPIAVAAGYLPVMRELAGQPIPRRVRILAPSLLNPMSLRRTGPRTVVVRPKHGYYTFMLDRLFRNDSHPMSVGQRVELTGMTVEVLSLTEDGRPAEAEFRFAVPLEDPSLRWLYWKDGVFIPFTPPAIGETVHFAPAIPSF